MSFRITKTPIVFAWVLSLAAAMWIAIWTASPAGWGAVMIVALLPAMMIMVMANAPAKSMAEIIREVEAERPR